VATRLMRLMRLMCTYEVRVSEDLILPEVDASFHERNDDRLHQRSNGDLGACAAKQSQWRSVGDCWCCM
jgi:hypothetical protein